MGLSALASSRLFLVAGKVGVLANDLAHNWNMVGSSIGAWMDRPIWFCQGVLHRVFAAAINCNVINLVTVFLIVAICVATGGMRGSWKHVLARIN